MGQAIFCDIKKERINGDKATSISSPSEPACDYDENFIDKVSSASYGAGLDIQQSQISGDVPSEDPLTTKDYYLGSKAAKFSLTTGVGSVETDENAIDKVSSASYAAGIQFENEEEFGDYEREDILADCQKLSLMAKFYFHPELPVVTTDPTATARCYFDRASAPVVLSKEEAEAHALILSDEASLEKLARDYMHPELPVMTTDPTASARCYFDRASAPVVLSKEEAEAHAQILSDEAALEQLAKDYMHPELPVVTTDPAATARCYFDRPSASTSATEKSDTFFSNRVQSNASEDPFNLDEDVIHHRDSTNVISSPSTQEIDETPMSKPNDEGKLSRSPSCVRSI